MKNRIILTSGLALFAMFFGAGNIIYPLELGAHAGNHILYVTLAFLIGGIGLPFLGLFATSLYRGDYWAFFGRLGKVPAFLLITFLIVFIGPLFAIPRTETVAFHTLEPFLPSFINNSYLFAGIYCLLLLISTYKQAKVIDLIGRILSPIKLILFGILIAAGIMGSHEVIENPNSIIDSIKLGLYDGYSTMDLLATFFFCTAVYNNLVQKAEVSGITSSRTFVVMFLKSCVIGALLLGVVYIGFMLVAYCHAKELQGVETAQMIVVVSKIVLGNIGSLFVGVCVGFACFVTGMALTDVSTNFFYEHVFNKKISRTICLIAILVAVYLMTIVGFNGIMKVALPLLEVLYPALIVYCIISILIKRREAKKIIDIATHPEA